MTGTLADAVAVGAASPPIGRPRRGLGVGGVVVLGALTLGALLGVLAQTVGLGGTGWVVGIGSGALLLVMTSRGLAGSGARAVGPANVVTLGRGLLTCAVAALTAESLLGRDVTLAVVVVAAPALALDAVDGWVARRTDSITSFGARFDGEVDAFLILVLSVVVSAAVGWWVVVAGLARYGFWAAARVLPWMRRPLPFRYWRKVVTATVGVTLVVASAGVLPSRLTTAALVGSLVLLGESFGRDVWWLWRRRSRPPVAGVVAPAERRARRIAWGVGRPVGDVLALVLVWVVLLLPARPDSLGAPAFLRVPLEAVLLAALALLLPVRWTRRLALAAGALLAVVTVVKVLDLGAWAALDRPFSLVADRSLLGSGLALVRDSLGPWAAAGVVTAVVLLVGAALVCVPWSLVRLGRVVHRHRRVAAPVLAVVAGAWALGAVTGAQVRSGPSLAAAEVWPFVADTSRATADALAGQRQFDAALRADAFAGPGSGDLAALRGRTVVLAFVESYGRVAVEGPDAGAVQRLLDAGTARLGAAGFGARSAFLTSPTFGGSSWLAHSTLKSGVRVADPWAYDHLLGSDRTTLTSAFARAGWRTVAVMPANHGPWPDGQAFYGFDRVYDRSGLGYAGPAFGFSPMPDQFTLAALDRLELRVPGERPVMAEVDLTSSHGPWAPLPTTVDEAALGDGSVFTGIRQRATTPARLWSDRRDVPAAYRASVAYSLESLHRVRGSAGRRRPRRRPSR